MLSRSIQKRNETRQMKRDMMQFTHRSHGLAHMWKQAVSKNSSLETSVFPQTGWLQVAQEKWKEIRGSRERRALLSFFEFTTSIAALCWEAHQQGILVTPELPENVINSKFCQASEVS